MGRVKIYAPPERKGKINAATGKRDPVKPRHCVHDWQFLNKRDDILKNYQCLICKTYGLRHGVNWPPKDVGTKVPLDIRRSQRKAKQEQELKEKERKEKARRRKPRRKKSERRIKKEENRSI